MNKVDAVLDAIKGYYGLKTYAELAVKLGVAQNTLNGWRTRQSYSAMLDKVVELAQKEKLPLDNFLGISHVISHSNISTVVDERTGGKNVVHQHADTSAQALNIDEKTMSIFITIYKNAAEVGKIDELNKELWAIGGKFV